MKSPAFVDVVDFFSGLFFLFFLILYFRFCYSTMMIQDYGTCLCVFYLLWPILCIYSNSNCWIGDDKSGRHVFCIAHCVTTTTKKITTTKKRQIGCGFHFFFLFRFPCIVIDLKLSSILLLHCNNNNDNTVEW